MHSKAMQQESFGLCMQAHDSAGGIGSALGSLAGKAVVAAQETSGAIKDKVNAADYLYVCSMCNTCDCAIKLLQVWLYSPPLTHTSRHPHPTISNWFCYMCYAFQSPSEYILFTTVFVPVLRVNNALQLLTTPRTEI